MTLKYPIDCITPAERTEYCYRAQELLRLERNTKLQDSKDEKITKEEWNAYLIKEFESRQAKIVHAILENRTALKTSTRWAIDLKEI